MGVGTNARIGDTILHLWKSKAMYMDPSVLIFSLEHFEIIIVLIPF